MKLLTLYRPVGPKELALIKDSGWKEFPPRLPEQPIFYPVTNEEYATQIARDWNDPVQKVGGATHTELWAPADELAEFNRNIVGLIEVVAEFRTVSSPATKPVSLFLSLRSPLLVFLCAELCVSAPLRQSHSPKSRLS